MLKEKTIKIYDFIIEYGILAMVFLTPLILDFAALSYNRVDLYKIVFFRIILSLMILAYLAKIFSEGKISLRGGNKIFWLVGFLLVSFFLSSWFSFDPGKSFWGDSSRQQGFYIYSHYLLFFVLLILYIKKFEQIKRIIMAAVAAGFLASIYGLIQYFYPGWLALGGLAGGDRVASTLGQPNFFGHWLIMVLPLGFYALTFLAKSFRVKLFIGLAVIFQFSCLVLTYSRAAWLGLAGSMAFLLLVWLVYRRRRKMIFGLAGLFFIGLISVIVLNMINPAVREQSYDLSLINRLKTAVNFNSGSGKMRLYYLESGRQIIKQAGWFRLLFGYGPETLANVFIKYYRQDWGVYETINSLPDRAHNWPLDQVLALGLLGVVANLAFYFYLIYKTIIFLSARSKLEADSWLAIFLAASLVAYCINNLFSFSLFTILVYLYLFLALVWLIINYQAEIKEIDIKLSAISKLLIWLSLLAVSVIFIYTNNLNQVRAEIHYIKALKSMNALNCLEVISQMDRAVNLSPSSDYYRTNYVSLMLDCFPLIEDRVVRERLRDKMLEQLALINNQATYEAKNLTARAYASFGFYLDKAYYIPAERIFNDLILNFPLLTPAYENLAAQKMTQDDYLGAIEIYNKALAILPPLDHAFLNDVHRGQIVAVEVRLDEGLGQAYFRIKDYDSAIAVFKKGLLLDPYRATLYKDIADVYYSQGRLDEAIIWNQRGFNLNPTDYHWPLALSLLYRDQSKLTQAKEYLNQALGLAPDNVELKEYYQELNN